MRLFKKGAALALAAMMALSSAPLGVMAADPNFQPEHEDTATVSTLKDFAGAAPLSAQVEELKGDELDVTLSTVWGDNGAMVGGTYTLNKAARFSTTYKRDANGNIAAEDKAKAEAELANYGGWVCDYRITVDSYGRGSINGDDVYLYGSYGGYENIAFKCSQLAETIPDGTYEIMAWTGLDSVLTYKDVVNSVKTFTCGLIDNGLEAPVTITVQLVVYDNRDRTAEETKCYYVGDPVIYEKKKSENPGEELIPVGDIDSTVKELPAEGVENLTVEGIKDAMVATEKTKLINDYIVENNITVPDVGTVMVDMDVYAKTEPLAENKFELTPHALITSDGQPDKDIEISNDQLEENAKIKIEVPSAKKPLYIMHRSEGYEPEKYTEGDPEEGLYFSYENGVCTFYVSHFSDIELITDPVMITDVDAYVDNAGTGNLRFITTYYGTDPVTNFGTWIVPQNIFNDSITAAKYANSTSTSISGDATFTADLMEIPDTMLDTVFYAKSYVNVGGSEAWTETAKEASVNQYKNNTSN